MFWKLTIHRMDPLGCSTCLEPLHRAFTVARPKSPILTVQPSCRKISSRVQDNRPVSSRRMTKVELDLWSCSVLQTVVFNVYETKGYCLIWDLDGLCSSHEGNWKKRGNDQTSVKLENPASAAELPKTDAETADYHAMGTFLDHKQRHCFISQSSEGIGWDGASLTPFPEPFVWPHRCDALCQIWFLWHADDGRDCCLHTIAWWWQSWALSCSPWTAGYWRGEFSCK